jgi:hypothetical protein
MGNGSCGNVIAALASFFIPGLGQLLQGRWLLAGLMFLWIIHLWSIVDAAVYRAPDTYGSRYGAYGRYY